MISAESLKKTMTSLLGEFVTADFPYERVAYQLSEAEKTRDLRLSPYGYVMWAVDHHGYKCAFRNLMASENVINGYVEAAQRYRDDMPVLLVNANMYVTKILANVSDLQACFRHLEGMTFPYVLYVLFAGGGQPDVVKQYRVEAEEQMKRYPSTLDSLPETFRKAGENLIDADAE